MPDYMRGSSRVGTLYCGKYFTAVRSRQYFRSPRKWGVRWGRRSELESPQNGPSQPKTTPTENYKRRWSCGNSKGQPSCCECSSNIKPQRSDRSLILDCLASRRRLGGCCSGEIGVEHLAAVEPCPRGRERQIIWAWHGLAVELEIEIQDGPRLVSWIVGMCENCWVA